MTKTGPVSGRKEGLKGDYSRIQKSVNPELYQKPSKNDQFWGIVANLLTKLFRYMRNKELKRL